MKSRWSAWIGWLVGAILLLSVALYAQEPVRAVRAIDDPATGMRWLLVRAANHPGGPGRLVRADMKRISASGALQPAVVAPLPRVLRGGDRLIVIERTPVAEANLEAIALGPAAVGETCEARLSVTGRRVRVIALGPGRALLAPSTFAEAGQQ